MPCMCPALHDAVLMLAATCLQLMGKERNKPLAERDDKPLRYHDREVCKYNLCGLCPNMLFTNTKSYLGEWMLAMTRSACCRG